ncbi:MAG: DUF1049 domain-containing protein, partial [Sedimentisphaerales bacterium]|nr:DUF1049 domain-containing protein [Sedimentisphaerales bacterium]
ETCMSFYKFKVYAKFGGIIFLVLLVIIFMASNREQVTVKFMGWEIWKAPLFAFIFAVASMGAVIFLVSKKVIKIWRDMKQLRREEKAQKELVDEVKKQVEQKEQSG